MYVVFSRCSFVVPTRYIDAIYIHIILMHSFVFAPFIVFHINSCLGSYSLWKFELYTHIRTHTEETDTYRSTRTDTEMQQRVHLHAYISRATASTRVWYTTQSRRRSIDTELEGEREVGANNTEYEFLSSTNCIEKKYIILYQCSQSENKARAQFGREMGNVWEWNLGKISVWRAPVFHVLVDIEHNHTHTITCMHLFFFSERERCALWY